MPRKQRFKPSRKPKPIVEGGVTAIPDQGTRPAPDGLTERGPAGIERVNGTGDGQPSE